MVRLSSEADYELKVVAPEQADAALEALWNAEGGKEASIVDEVHVEPARMFLMHTGSAGPR